MKVILTIPAFLHSKKGVITILIMFVAWYTVHAQRVFVKPVNGTNRSYQFYSNVPETYQAANRPLIIVLHQTGKSASQTFAGMAATTTKKPFALIFPNSTQAGWKCTGDSALRDMDFIKGIISDTYDNFHINRNLIYILSDKSDSCFVSSFIKAYPDIIADSRSLPDFQQDLSASIDQIINNSAGVITAENRYNLWTDPFAPKKMPPLDSLINYRLHNRWVIDFRAGGVGMFGSVKTDIKDETYMDLSKAHTFLDLTVTKWINDSLGVFADAGWLQVPKKMEMNGEKVSVGGGMIIPVTIGLKYALFRKSFFHPYILLGGGIISVVAVGGRFNKSSLRNGVPNLKSGDRRTLQFSVGSGVDMRMSKRIVLGAHLHYIHSAGFKSLGNIDAIRGVNVTGSIGYIINANSLKKLPFPLKQH